MNSLFNREPNFIERHWWKIWVIGMLIALLILAGTIYAVVHFVGKYW